MQECAPGTNQREVTIRGEPHQTQYCMQLLNQKIAGQAGDFSQGYVTPAYGGAAATPAYGAAYGAAQQYGAAYGGQQGKLGSPRRPGPCLHAATPVCTPCP